MRVFRRQKNAFLEISSTFEASSCLKWVFNYKKQGKKFLVICTLKAVGEKRKSLDTKTHKFLQKAIPSAQPPAKKSKKSS